MLFQVNKEKQFIVWIMLVLATGFANLNAQPIKYFRYDDLGREDGIMQRSVTDLDFGSDYATYIASNYELLRYDGREVADIGKSFLEKGEKVISLYQANGGLCLITSRRILFRKGNRPVVQKFRFPEGFEVSASKKHPSFYILYSGVEFYTLDTSFKKLTHHPLIEGFVFCSTGSALFADRHHSQFLVNTSKRVVLYDFMSSKFIPIPENSSNNILNYLGVIDDDMLMFTGSGLSRINMHTGIGHQLIAFRKPRTILSRWGILTLKDGNVALGIDGDLFLLDSTFSKLLYIMKPGSEAGFTDNAIKSIKQDAFGNLYVLTLSDGVKKIYFNPLNVQYYGSKDRGANFATSVYYSEADKFLYQGSMNKGLQYFDGNKTAGKIASLASGTALISLLFPLPAGGTGAIIGWNDTIYKVDAGQKALIPYLATQGDFRYPMQMVYRNKDTVLLFSDGTLTSLVGNKVSHKKIDFFTREIFGSAYKDGKLYVAQDSRLMCYDIKSSKQLWSKNLKGYGIIRSLHYECADSLLIGFERGLLIGDKDGNIRKSFTRANGLANEFIYSIACADSSIWVGTNEGIIQIKRNGTVRQLTLHDGLQANEFNTNAVWKADDGQLFFGGVAGVNSFYPKDLSGNGKYLEPRILLSAVVVNGDTLSEESYDKENIFAYNQNRFSVRYDLYGAYKNSDYYQFYRLIGFDSAWQPCHFGEAILFNLRPGTYSLELCASLQQAPTEKPLAVYHFTIQKPIWQKPWLYILLALLMGFIIYKIVNLQAKRKYNARLKYFQQQQMLQEQRNAISRDLHDNIGVQANLLLHSSEKLLEKKEDNVGIAENMAGTARQMLLSLRETLWALKNQEASANDVWLRMINFSRQMERHYAHTSFKNIGSAPKDVMLNSGYSLNIIMLLQEALNNAVKHANAKNIITGSHYDAQTKRWQIEVRDDGAGFDMSGAAKESYGLDNMRHRANEIGANFSIDSKPGAGTTIRLVIPL